MTVVWVLDTDHLSLFQREHPIVTQHLNQTNFVNTAITVVTLEEQMKGWLNVINKYNDQPDHPAGSQKSKVTHSKVKKGMQAPKFIYGK